MLNRLPTMPALSHVPPCLCAREESSEAYELDECCLGRMHDSGGIDRLWLLKEKQSEGETKIEAVKEAKV